MLSLLGILLGRTEILSHRTSIINGSPLGKGMNSHYSTCMYILRLKQIVTFSIRIFFWFSNNLEVLKWQCFPADKITVVLFD